MAIPIANAQNSDVLTYHNDNSRSGQNLNEEILSLTNVNTNHFGKLWVLNVDGKVDAQPLYVAGLKIPGQGERNVVFIATEHDSVYAFDADSTNMFWHVSLLGKGETTSDTRSCTHPTPEIGIVSTPVIDRHIGTNGTLFVVGMSKDSSGNYYQRLHALDLATGADRISPATISAIYQGTGDNSSGGWVVFDPGQYEERIALLLLNGVIYTGWASHCDIRPYTGWIIGYDSQTLTQACVLNITPNGNGGALWMSGAGLAADSSNNIYALEGNGTFDTTLDSAGFPNQGDFGNAFLKLSNTNENLGVEDYFATHNTVSQSANDTDLGAGGALVLPDLTNSLGQVVQLAVGAGKDGNIYIVDRSNMGRFNSSSNAIYQQINGALGSGGVYATPAYFNGRIYYGAVSTPLLAFPFTTNALLGAPTSQSPTAFVYPGTTPSISASGTSNGIVWASENTTTATLHAYDASNLTNEIYNSNMAAGGADQFGAGNRFVVPTIASARVYVATSIGVGVFGLLDQSALTPLEVWRDNNFENPSNVGQGSNPATPAGDGIPNLIKYALGLDPFTVATTAQMPVGSILSDSGQDYLAMTVNRVSTAPDISYIVEVSGDLQTWQSGPPYTVTLTNTETQLLVRDNVSLPSASARFIRLRVTNP